MPIPLGAVDPRLRTPSSSPLAESQFRWTHQLRPDCPGPSLLWVGEQGRLPILRGCPSQAGSRPSTCRRGLGWCWISITPPGGTGPPGGLCVQRLPLSQAQDRWDGPGGSYTFDCQMKGGDIKRLPGPSMGALCVRPDGVTDVCETSITAE